MNKILRYAYVTPRARYIAYSETHGKEARHWYSCNAKGICLLIHSTDGYVMQLRQRVRMTSGPGVREYTKWHGPRWLVSYTISQHQPSLYGGNTSCLVTAWYCVNLPSSSCCTLVFVILFFKSRSMVFNARWSHDFLVHVFGEQTWAAEIAIAMNRQSYAFICGFFCSCFC